MYNITGGMNNFSRNFNEHNKFLYIFFFFVKTFFLFSP